jgi:hypothetical protein
VAGRGGEPEEAPPQHLRVPLLDRPAAAHGALDDPGGAREQQAGSDELPGLEAGGLRDQAEVGAHVCAFLQEGGAAEPGVGGGPAGDLPGQTGAGQRRVRRGDVHDAAGVSGGTDDGGGRDLVITAQHLERRAESFVIEIRGADKVAQLIGKEFANDLQLMASHLKVMNRRMVLLNPVSWPLVSFF